MARTSPTVCSACANAPQPESTRSTSYALIRAPYTVWPYRSPPQTHGMVKRFNGRIEEVLQFHHFRFGEASETTRHRYVLLYTQQLPQSALKSRTPLQGMTEWHRVKPELFKEQPYYLTGCDT